MNHVIGQTKALLDTPVLLVDLNNLQRNIDRMAATIIRDAGVRWRPHTKAMKTPTLAYLCLEAGAKGVTCAKLGEAEVMAAAGIHDILVANEIVGPLKIERLVNLCRYTDVIVCVDDIGNAEAIDRAAAAKRVRPRVLVEVDVGMARAGVPPGNPAVSLAKQITDLENVRFAGLQTWEAHALGAESIEERKKMVAEALGALTSTADQIRESGIPVDIVSCGGTGTYWISAFEPGITEVEAGGGIFCDVRYRKGLGVDLEYALTVLSTVTSRPTGRRIVCDAGFKTMGDAHGEPELLGFGEVETFALSAEHGVITLAESSDAPRVGEKIEIIPGYSDSTVFLHDTLHAVRDGRVEAVWPLLGRGKLL
jgi:D-serine deaminase-like pyridoxal phosphate-dependent protein